MRRVYTRELLQPIVQESLSMMEVIRKLGFRVHAGGTHAHVTRKIKEFGIDTSHFLGQARNRGREHKGGLRSRTADEILIKRDTGYRERHIYLVRALLEIGREYKCYLCGISEWLGKKLTLQVEHKNGDPLDDRRGNLEFICPNCHSQTDTYCNSKRAEVAE